jgi:ABC-type spermidine/putrescine transport system permease subunit I
MDWEALLRSSVTAAIITGIVAVIGFWVSAATARKINEDKLALDEHSRPKRREG